MPLRITFAAEAERDFNEAIDYISVDNPTAAERMAARVEKSLRLLTARPHLGRPAPETGQPGMRRLSVPPYVIFDLVGQETIQVARMLHGARQLDDERHFRAGSLTPDV